jgi:hypothetical protein
VNVLRRSFCLNGALLWPSWQDPPDGAPAEQRAQTGVIQNHFRYRPGVLNAAPQAPAWATPEQIHEGSYAYDKQHPGKPLPNIDVDLFHADAGVDFNDYAQLDKFYRESHYLDERVKKLKIRFTKVDILDDQDLLGAGELTFEATIDGQKPGKTAQMKGRTGQRGLSLAWTGPGAGVIEVDVAGRGGPISIALSGEDEDLLSTESLGTVTAEIRPAWPKAKTSGSASGAGFVAYWEIEPVLMTEEERAAAAPEDASKKAPEEKLADALIGSRRTDAEGRFSFPGLRAGEYVLHARARLSFIENRCPGGEVGPPPQHQHNGVHVAALSALRGAHRMHLKVNVDAHGGVQVLTTNAGAEVASTPDRLLPPGKTLGDIQEDTPYRFYALPLVVASHAAQWNACAEELRRAFQVEVAQAITAMETTAVLDLAALSTWEHAGPGAAAAIAAGGPTDELLKQTLLLGGPAADQRTMAYDHVTWCFAARDATARTRGRFVPLDTAGFFSGAGHLYGLATKTKDSYGRYALRFLAGNLDGLDIRELKTRLVLWGSNARFVDMRNDTFDQAVREALLRFKRDREIFRRRVNAANGTPDVDKSFLTTIVDGDTYAALDQAQPPLLLANVADTNDPGNVGTALLNEDGYCRLVFYAAEIARRRVASNKVIRIHSSFRTLAHNRRVYLGNNNLRWRLATNAPAAQFVYGGFTTMVGGVTGADGSNHAANAAVTAATIRDGEPRGTYVSAGQNDHWAPDYSKHTRGTALDFCLATPPAAHAASVAQVQWDTNAITLFGAVRGGNSNGHLWLEPPSSAIAPNAPGAFANGTTNWIHIDTGSIPNDRLEFVLTDADVLGPRWSSNLIVRGRVTSQGNGRLGARVELLDGATVLATTYTDRAGSYSLRMQGGAVRGGYSVRATFQRPYVFQPPQPQAAAVTASVAIAFTYAGAEVTAADIALPG